MMPFRNLQIKNAHQVVSIFLVMNDFRELRSRYTGKIVFRRKTVSPSAIEPRDSLANR